MLAYQGKRSLQSCRPSLSLVRLSLYLSASLWSLEGKVYKVAVQQGVNKSFQTVSLFKTSITAFLQFYESFTQVR